MIPRETTEQQCFVNWFKVEYNQYIIAAVPNGGKRGTIEAENLRKEGVLSGTPDLFILLDNGVVVFIEFKRQKKLLKSGKYSNAHSKPSEDQIKFKAKAELLNHTVIFAYGFDDAVIKFEAYLHLSINTIQ